jgi:hypothetical protein
VLRFLRRWSHRELLASWVGYWVVLIAVVAGPAIARWWTLQRSGAHGTVSLSVEAGALETILWITVPPLLLGVAWLLARPRRGDVAPPRAPGALPPPSIDDAALREARRRPAGERSPRDEPPPR